MFFSRIPIVMLVATALFTACLEAPQPDSKNKNIKVRNIVAAAFVPPADSSITPAQLDAWFACNSGLDSLAQAFSGPAAEKAVPCDSVRQRFRGEQDRICVSGGLKSGYAEHEWITDNLGHSRNKAAFDSMKSSK